MTKPRIVVTGATGKTGRLVVSELLKAGYPVRALVHREDARSARLRTPGRGNRSHRSERYGARGRRSKRCPARVFFVRLTIRT